jgi:hypothetical protein
MRTFSFGGGVQSTAVLVLQAQNKLPDPYDVFLFANVGDDSEHPDTIEYFHNVHKPFAEKHGIQLEEIKRVKRDGTTPTLLEEVMIRDKRGSGPPLPMWLENGAPARRICTSDWKILVVRKWQRQNGSSRDNPFVCGLGISVDEIHRARTDSGFPDQTLDYPLIDMGLRRSDCTQIIKEAGLPDVGRSACWFCPFHGKQHWRDLRNKRPDLFEKTVQLEKQLTKTRHKAKEEGKKFAQLSPNIYFSRLSTKVGLPLNEVIDDQLQLDLDGPDSCDSGSCFT